MSPEQKRAAIKRVYSSPNWEDKVDKMSDAQVHNIYIRMLNKGELK